MLDAGQSVGRYRILSPIRSGPNVFTGAAFDSQFERIVLLKVLHSQTRDGSEGAVRVSYVKTLFLREAELLGTMNHPHVVRLLDVEPEAAQPHFACEWIPPGLNLGQALTRTRGPITPPKTVQLGVVLSRVLAYIHSRRIVHRDVSPTNIVVGATKTSLVDFGYSRQSGGDPLDALWQSIADNRMVYGTPGFVAPEVLARDSLGTAQSDLWSLCAVLYVVCTSSYPFPYYSEKQRTHLNSYLPQNAEALAARSAKIPRPLLSVLERGLQADPSERFSSGEELADALQSLSL